MSEEILHREAERCFALVTAEGEASVHYRPVAAGVWDFWHTWVPEALRGRGVAARLVEHALEHCRARGLRVVASCSYVEAWMQRNDGRP